jgi:hypothetical protein
MFFFLSGLEIKEDVLVVVDGTSGNFDYFKIRNTLLTF